MARKRATHSRADIKAQIALLESIGKKVVQVKFHPDGTFRLITADAVNKGTTNAEEPALVGWDDVRPNGQV